MAIDLNADLGDGLLDADDSEAGQLMTIISSANIACGGQAGDSDSMTRACRLAADNGVAIGAHLSFQDREGFGQRKLNVTSDVLTRQLLGQLEILDELALTAGSAVTYVKTHGALYHLSVTDCDAADAVVRAVALFRERTGRSLAVLGSPHSALTSAALGSDLRAFGEALVDRNYLPNGQPLSRTDEGAVINDPNVVMARLHSLLLEGTLEAADGSAIDMEIRSIRISASTSADIMLARRIHSAVMAERIRIAPFAPPPVRERPTRQTGADSRQSND